MDECDIRAGLVKMRLLQEVVLMDSHRLTVTDMTVNPMDGKLRCPNGII